VRGRNVSRSGYQRHPPRRGDLDFRGTLSVDKEAPVGFTAIRLNFTLQTDADEDQLATLLRLTERYYVIFQTLAGSPALLEPVSERGFGW
jgi:uncharacterized OsmC-like protein